MSDDVYSLYDAKTHLSRLVERAAKGEEIVIAKNGVPVAKLVGVAFRGEPRRPANAMGITRIAEDFDAPDRDIERLFSGGAPQVDLLLDTHVFLWWDVGDPRLGGGARAAVTDPANRVFVSAASVWEIAIKSARGKLAFRGSPTGAIAGNGFLPLAISPAHAEAAGTLGWMHPDPFDRMLVAQAIAQSLVLVHADAVIRGYAGVTQLWAS